MSFFDVFRCGVMNRKDYCILPICFLLYGLTFFACGGDEEIYPSYPPERNNKERILQ